MPSVTYPFLAAAAALLLTVPVHAQPVHAPMSPGRDGGPASAHERVKASALLEAPKRFVGRPIEIRRVRCFMATVGQYRCGVRDVPDLIFVLAAIEPPEQRKVVDTRCAELYAALHDAVCRFDLRLVPTTQLNSELQGRERTIVGAQTGTLGRAR